MTIPVDFYITNPCVDSLSVSNSNPIGCRVLTFTVTLTRVAPDAGTLVLIDADRRDLIDLPYGVEVTAGSLTATFTGTTRIVPVDVPVTVYCTFNGVTEATVLDLMGYLPNAEFASHDYINAPNANQYTLCTIANGRRTFVQMLTCHNPTVGTVTFTFVVKRAGVTLPGVTLTAAPTATSVTAGQVGAPSLAQFVFEYGDVIYVTPSAAGVTVRMITCEFDDTSPLRSYILSTALGTIAAGNNTLLTTPNGYTDDILTNSGLLSVPYNSAIFYVNTSGGTRTLNLYKVPAAGAPSTTNRTATANQSITNNNANIPSTAPNAAIIRCVYGDTIVVNIDANTAGQSAWVNTLRLTT